MTITSNILRKDYTANGVNTTFAFDFPIFYESNATPKFSLEVIITDILGVETIKVETTDYTVNYNQTDYVNGVISQGNVVLNTAPTLNYKVSILRKLNFTQNNDITTSGSDALPGTALEGSLDKLTLISLQILENLNRVVKLPKSSQLTNIEFPINSSSANQILAINNDGNNLTTKDLADVGLAPVSSYIKTLLDDTTSSQARTTLDAQQLNSNLTALAGLSGASNKLPYFTGSGAMALRDLLATSTSQGIVYLPNPVSFTNNTTDTNNDMDFTQGVINYDDGSGQSVSSLNLTKQLDATFVEGTNAGGLDTGTKANSTWYQIFAITKNTTGVVDFLYSTSRTSPTVPSGWTRRAWLGAIRTNSSGNIDQNYSARRTSYGQVVSFQTGEYLSGPGIIPNDDTPPQIDEGSKFMELLINPLNSTSKLEISGQAFLFNSSASAWRAISALFKGSDVNSIATAEGVNASGSYVIVTPFFATVNSGTTNSITFQFRAGTESSSTTYFNGNAARRYGGSFSSFLTIKEYL